MVLGARSAVVAGVLATVQILSIRQESQNLGRGFEIVGGYQYLTTGEYPHIGLKIPPLERIFGGAFHFCFCGRISRARRWKRTNTASSDVDAGVEFLYHNRIPADTMPVRGAIAYDRG